MDASWEACFEAFNDLSKEYLESLPKRKAGNVDCAAWPFSKTNFAEAGLGLPETGVGFEEIVRQVREDIIPNLSGQPGPRYLAYVTGGSTPVATFADWLVSCFDQNVKKHGCSISLQIERQALRWLVELFSLPRCFEGIFTTGCTAANFLSILSGRQYAGNKQGVDVAKDGVGAFSLKVISSTPHESIMKCLSLAGIGQNNFQHVPTVNNGSECMDAEALDKALAGMGNDTGKIVVASCGTVSGTAFDDLVDIRKVCDKYDAWMHVDGAFGIFERLITGSEGKTKGLEYADSIAFDCHKWLNIPYDCGVCLVRDIQYLKQSCHVDSPYFKSSGPEPDFLSLGIENSRRFRGFPVWVSLLGYGRMGITNWVKKDIKLARDFSVWLSASDKYDLVFYGGLNVVMFEPVRLLNSAVETSDQETLNLLRNINTRGVTYMNATTWDGKKVIRAAFSNYSTTVNDLQLIFQELNAIASSKMKSKE
mmetsp:Transcript_6190/g.7514  ORF Transcript_6190/g.7514 Transcript_6190/m.7514 type:complete len:479 (+) Transcript_6190:198-1634(+)|eukprot:CAMPEP_0204829090 /NCGR_PEP_ID=MMETSP1346-20131115/7099_1 /ASSEMBLY_ACC=CAM_ASM_000771 /TAXON_ID=215587 /ORGANISM="Aplanochytrium stocchinoi, Strain GSBS06" /LENGTH=478 /DNA_ID=CAMNT_0051958603 /DNA_START=119 /DNA_END=1555 /DNA_ORIENTATION=-